MRITLLVLISLILASSVSAVVITIQNPLGEGAQLETIIDRLIDFIFKIAIVLVPLMVLIGAFQIMTAAGDVNKVATGKNIIIYTLIGFAIVLLAKGIMGVIKQILGVE